MQNNVYPFNQKEHIFDFKVKVNFENGNVSLTAPQIVTPPARINNLSSTSQNNQQMYTSPSYNYQNVNNIQPNAVLNQYSLPVPNYLPQNYPYQNLQSNTIPSNNNIVQGNNIVCSNQVQPIQLVNSSYTSMRQGQYSSMINNSMQIIQCVLCQKSFAASQFDQHLQLHRNKNNRTNLTNQKNNASNYALTQNSFNHNDSIISNQHSNSGSFQNQNQSYHSNGVYSTRNNNSQQNIVPNFANNQNNSLSNGSNGSFNNNSPIKQNNEAYNQTSSHLLGRIDNPILAINAAQQANLSLSSSNHNQNHSLNYSNSYNQSTTRFKDPNLIHSIQNSPNFNQIHNSNSSSFGNHGGNNVIGPSFFHNSSQQSANNNIKNGPFLKGINRLAYNDANNSDHSLAQGQTNVPLSNVLPSSNQNQSYHSYHSSYSHPSQHHFSNSSHHFQLYNQPQIMNGSQQNIYQQPNIKNFVNPNNQMQSYHSYQSNPYLQNIPVIPPSNMMMQNFQTIESRYLNQPAVGNSRKMYASQQQLKGNSKNNFKQFGDGLFNENDISSISGSSKGDLSQYSDWSDLNQAEDLKLQGYNSADNSLIKYMQHKKKQQDKSSMYLDRNDAKQKTQEGFFKKKKDHMVNSANSYYDKKFKDQNYSSSDDDQYMAKTGRLSYAQRLKQKRYTDNRPVQLTASKSIKQSKNLKQSHRSNNMSKCSEDSSLSKTKIPVNYLARQQFISTSSTSKSTHKTTAPN